MAANQELSAIKRHTLSARFGNTLIAPLASAPRIEFNRKTVDSLICENKNVEKITSYLVRDSALITLETKDIITALELMSSFTLGENIISPERERSLSFAPGAEKEKTLIFPAAYLLPESTYIPSPGKDHLVKLVFKAIALSGERKLFSLV